MTICQLDQWGGKNYQECIDLGSQFNGDGDELFKAKQMFVIIMVGTNKSWKIPLGNNHHFQLPSNPNPITNPIKEIAKLVQSINLDRMLLVFQKVATALAEKTTTAEVITAFLSSITDKASLLRPPCTVTAVIHRKTERSRSSEVDNGHPKTQTDPGPTNKH